MNLIQQDHRVTKQTVAVALKSHYSTRFSAAAWGQEPEGVIDSNGASN